MIKSIKKAIDILLYLSNFPEEPMPLWRITQDMDMNKTTCFHILETLHDSLLIEKVSSREGYRLGPVAYMLTRYGRYQESLIVVCLPIIKWLKRQIDATILLTVVCDGIKYIILHVDGEERFDYKNSEIIQGHLETTATGMLMMAYMDGESMRRVNYRSGRKKDGEQETTQAALMHKRLLKKIQTDGYAHVSIAAEQRQSYAFRIWDGKRTVAAIGVLYANKKDNEEMRRDVIKKGKLAAKEISRRLMFRVVDDNCNNVSDNKKKEAGGLVNENC